MSWIEGTIEEFKGSDPRHRELRKVRTNPEQSWNELYFFRISLATAAGYPVAALAAGQRIEFEPDPRAARPQVLRFKPYIPRDRPAAEFSRTFLNPYHFVPLAPPSSLVPAAEVLEGTLHDRFGPVASGEERYSGRIVCRLETEGPVVVGAEQRRVGGDENHEREVFPFGLPDPAAPKDPWRRTPMIPGSTLRGLVSSLVEAASCSALRVLPERRFTRRAAMGEALSAVGLLVEEEGALRLRPLTLSVGEMSAAASEPPRNRCRVLLNGYRFDQDKKKTEPLRSTFLASEPASASSSRQDFWYLDLATLKWHWKGRFCLGLITDRSPIPEADLGEAERKRYQRGLLFVLGLDGGKAENLPPGKKHEYFLPYPAERETEPTLAIPQAVLDEFQDLAADAAEISRGAAGGDLPFLPAGRAREAGGVVPRAGDLMYYEKDEQGRVGRLSFSALWRRRVPGSLHQAVARISPDLLPFHSGRKRLTLAERLFGFVEPQGPRALAGRLRFAHGVVEGEAPEGGWYEGSIPLKILAAPKPPSPALYFGHEGYLAKRDLHLARHAPGRKVYLHHRRAEVEARSYETADLEDKRKLKARVRPLREGTRFLFHVDFVNLNREELGYLLYALRPREEFRHKVGMGRPLGLGRVRIDPVALAWMDRRYAADSLFAGKYAALESRWEAEAWRRLADPLARRYRYEVEAAALAVGSAGRPRLAALVEEARARIPERVRHALELLGDPEAVRLPVSYPVRQGQTAEGEHFQWFVDNDRMHRKALSALWPGSGLSVLDRYEPQRRH